MNDHRDRIRRSADLAGLSEVMANMSLNLARNEAHFIIDRLERVYCGLEWPSDGSFHVSITPEEVASVLREAALRNTKMAAKYGARPWSIDIDVLSAKIRKLSQAEITALLFCVNAFWIYPRDDYDGALIASGILEI